MSKELCWFSWLATGLLALLSLGCGASLPAGVKPVRLADLDRSAPVSLPLLVEFRPGDELPLEVHIDGDLLQSEATAQPVSVRVKKTFYVLITGDGPPRISLDGQTLARVPGQLSIGLGVSQQGPKATLGLSLNEAR